jgi:hypothetical protein
MGLIDFFRINLPYGLKRNSSNEWFVFNREYVPLGWNSIKDQKSIFDDKSYSELPVHTKYKGLNDSVIASIFTDPESIHRDESGVIKSVFFYNDGTNPVNDGRHWDAYIKKIKALSKLTTGAQ